MTQRRCAAILGVVACLGAGLLTGTSRMPHARGAAALNPAAIADAFTASDQPASAHDTGYVSMDGSPRRRGYFKFSVTVPAGHRVTSAVFRCVASRSNGAGLKLWRTSNAWAARTLTWRNAPVPNLAAHPLGLSGPVTGGAYLSVNVTAAITGTGTYTLLAGTSSTSQWSCLSREHSARRPPRLAITTAPGPATFRAIADAYIADDQAATAHNTGYLALDASPRRRGYVKFSVVVPAGQHVTKAVFRCVAGGSSGAGLAMWKAGNTWSESTLTWGRAPVPNTALPLGSSGPVTGGRYTSATVTRAITGSGTFTLVARTSSSAQWTCLSKEHGNGTPPLLEVTSSDTVTVDATADGGAAPANWNAPMSAAIRADNPTVFLWAGDVRNTGTPAEWALYDQHYGALKWVTLPTPGNHDWASAATGYDVEFRVGAPYADVDTYCNAITLGNGWRLFSFNTYTQAACLPALSAFLAAPGTRKIVVTHAPRWSGGGHGSAVSQAPIWDAMKGRAFALVAGHDHDSQVIERDGLLQIISGCAGASYSPVTAPIEGEVYYTTDAADCTYLRLVLGPATATVQAVHPDGSIDFAKTYPVTAS